VYILKNIEEEEEKKLHVAQPLAIKNKNKQRKKRQKTLAPRIGRCMSFYNSVEALGRSIPARGFLSPLFIMFYTVLNYGFLSLIVRK